MNGPGTTPLTTADRCRIEALASIDRHFYDEASDAFHRTRREPWPGWEPVLDLLGGRLEAGADGDPLSVVDLGCGNGRFGRLLAERLPPGTVSYVGVDSSAGLLERARRDLPADRFRNVELLPVDLIRRLLDVAPLLPDPAPPAAPESDGARRRRTRCADPDVPGPAQRGHDAAVAFGLTHHLPGPLQATFLGAALACLRRGGLLAVSWWGFATDPRLARRRLSWDWAVERGFLTPEQVDGLDGNDWLLRWGGEAEDRARYCRFTPPEEVQAMVTSACAVTGARRLDTYRADGASGRLNQYVLIEGA